jgi:hypothetical protein
MNTLSFQNILAILDIHVCVPFSPSVKLYQCTKKNLKNTTEIEIQQFVNGDDSSDNAQ